MLLREHRSKDQGLNDKLNYAHISPDGFVSNKDGAYIVTFKAIGPDMDTAGTGQLNGFNDTVNRALLNLEDGWMIHVDDIRVPATSYPNMADFPCDAARLIDEERRFQYESGEHYENMQYLTFVWKFPVEKIKVKRSLLVTNVKSDEQYTNAEALLKKFKDTVAKCINALSTYIYLEQLSAADMLAFLNTCITGKLKPIQVPPPEMFLDVVLASEPLVCGLAPKIGKNHIRVLSIMGTDLVSTFPGILEALSSYPMVYRVSNRFIAFSQNTADKELRRYRKQWNNMITGLWGIMVEAFTNKPLKNPDEHAMEMKDEVLNAIKLNKSGALRFGYWACEIVFMGEDIGIINTALEDFKKHLDSIGFNSLLETYNTEDAYMGTIPGHGSCNVRRIFMHSRQLAHVLPLGTVWAGDERVSKSSLLPKNAPVCFYANTIGRTPFRHNVDHEDVGHATILGPTSSGKSAFVQIAISQFLRYKDAQVFIFDKDLSHYGWTYAMGGSYYNIGGEAHIGFAPFKHLETKTELSNAIRFAEMLCELQGMKLTPEHKKHIADAVKLLATTAITDDRSLSNLITYADDSIKKALGFYSLNGTFDMLDSKTDSIRDGHLHAFEMGWLIKQEKQYYLPILMHQFNTITSFLEKANTKHPTIIVLEEAWQYLEHEVFSKFIIDWMKTMRKFNARVWLATQSLADLYEPNTGALRPSTAAVLDNCATRIFLPNNNMEAQAEKLYAQIGLSERQIEIVRNAVPKKDYFLVRPPLSDSENKFSGCRLFDFGWSNLDYKPLALSFIGLPKAKSSQLADLIRSHQGEDGKANEAAWLPKWLSQEGQYDWLKYYNNNYAATLDMAEGEV